VAFPRGNAPLAPAGSSAYIHGMRERAPSPRTA